MKVVRQKFCMHLERGEMPVTKAVKNWRLFLSESVEMGKKADDRRERERGGFGAANPCVFIHRICEGSGARWGREGGDTPWIIGPPAAVLPGLPLRGLNPLACSGESRL